MVWNSEINDQNGSWKLVINIGKEKTNYTIDLGSDSSFILCYIDARFLSAKAKLQILQRAKVIPIKELSSKNRL